MISNKYIKEGNKSCHLSSKCQINSLKPWVQLQICNQCSILSLIKKRKIFICKLSFLTLKSSLVDETCRMHDNACFLKNPLNPLLHHLELWAKWSCCELNSTWKGGHGGKYWNRVKGNNSVLQSISRFWNLILFQFGACRQRLFLKLTKWNGLVWFNQNILI